MFNSVYSWLLDQWPMLVLDLVLGALIFFVPFFLIRRYRNSWRQNQIVRRTRIFWLRAKRSFRRLQQQLSSTALNPRNLLPWSDHGARLWVWVPLVAVAWVFGFDFLAGIFPVLWLAVEVMEGICALLVLFPPIPGAVSSLLQQPNRFRPTPAEIGKAEDSEITTRDYPPSWFGYFVKLVPGREIRIERGGIAVKGMMATDHRMYLGEQDNDLTPKHAEYWENVLTPPEYEDSHPIPVPWKKRTWRWLIYSPLSIAWWLWKRYVYKLTGAVFTGFYPFQMPRVVPMERFVMRVKDGKAVVDRIEDYSNHYRVEQFMFPLLIGDVDTKDMIPLKVLLNIVASVFNSYLTAYRTDDRWSSRLIASITDPITAYARATPLGTLWVAASEAVARTLAERVLAIGRRPPRPQPPALPDPLDPRSPCVYGIQVHSVEIIDISPMNDADTVAFGEEARARVKNAAMKLLAEGGAAPVSETIKALAGGDAVLRDNPNAVIIARMNADVQMAQAAGPNGNLVVMGGTSNNDPIQTAVLQALRQLAQNNRSAG